MGIEKIIKIAVALTIAGAVTGNLPSIIKHIQIAQIKLIQESKASDWGKLKVSKNKKSR